MSKNILVGFYQVEGEPENVVVEVPLTGHAKADHVALDKALLAKYPKVKSIRARRVGSCIEQREEADMGPIDTVPGQTLRQLFPENGDEPFRHIGVVFFEGRGCDVQLRYHRARASVGITLIDRMTRNATRFSNQIHAGLLVTELPRLVREVLGNRHRDLKLRMVNPGTDPNRVEFTHNPNEPKKPTSKKLK